jgi:hypothetical protein
MSGWLAIGLFVIGLVAVAVAVLISDIVRGDVGGGRHTMERARRLLVIATDDETLSKAQSWVEWQRTQASDRQFFLLSAPDSQDLYDEIEDAVERERPDAIVVARHGGEHRHALEGVYGRLKEELQVPVDAIYSGEPDA